MVTRGPSRHGGLSESPARRVLHAAQRLSRGSPRRPESLALVGALSALLAFAAPAVAQPEANPPTGDAP